MRTAHTTTHNLWHRVEVILLAAGLTGVSVWIAAIVAPVISQDWGNWVFDREASGRTATFGDYLGDRRDKILGDMASEWRAFRERGKSNASVVVPGAAPSRTGAANPLKERDLIGRLEIARLNLKTIVREGAQEGTLSIAAGHIPSTALPGQPGNVGVAGHRDTLFRGLKGIQKGDLIQFESLNGSYVYQVDSTQIVKPTDVAVLNPDGYPELTLVTCYPFTFIGSAPDRFIVKARQVLSSTVKPDLSAIPATVVAPVVKPHATPPAIAAAAEPPASPAQSASAANDASASHDFVAQSSSPASTRINFSVANSHSRQLAPGISMGVDTIDPEGHAVNGWIWVMPDKRTVWIKHQPPRDPIVFYQDGKRRELILTSLSASAANGYLLMRGVN